MEPEKRKRRPLLRRRGFWIGIAVLLLVLLGVVWFFTRYLPLDGHLYPRKQEALDLREQSLTLEQHTALTERLPGCRIRWSVPLGGRTFDSESECLTLTEFAPEELSAFFLFPHLKEVDASGCDNYDALEELKAALPDCHVHWTVPLGDTAFPQDALYARASLREISPEELAENLALLPRLRVLRVEGGQLKAEEMALLRAARPDVQFLWKVMFCGKLYSNREETVSLAGRTDITPADLPALCRDAAGFDHLRELDLTGCGLENKEFLSLQEALPETDIRWTFELCGVTVSSLDREIDLSRISIPDPAVVEEALPYLRYVEKIDMSRCGLSDETMDALNRKYDDIRFVWTVFFADYSLRTDATSFIAARFMNHAELYNNQVQCLRYCTDLEALDLGHMKISDLSFLYSLPKLRYLIMVENPIRDITPIGSLKDLTYLEIFWTMVEDLSPLKNCKKLQDLNICYIYAKPDDAYEVLMDMPWLDRLWYCGNTLSPEQLSSLQERMPDCEMYMGAHDESTGGSWRYHPHYYEMRDFFGMYYMKGGTNGVGDDGTQLYG